MNVTKENIVVIISDKQSTTASQQTIKKVSSA